MRQWMSLMVAVALALLLAVQSGAAGTAHAQGEVQTASHSGFVYHTVRAGETVSGIALHYGVTAQSIISANGLRPPYLIYTGQTLRIPRSAPIPAQHIVRAGETVYAIGRLYGVTPQSIIAANGLRPPYTIYVGQVLAIPGGGAPTPPPSRTHVVRAGENLYRIGLLYGVPWGDIAVANGLRYPFTLSVGQVLQIPTGGTSPIPTPRISVTSPAAGVTVSSPVRVSGWGLASFEQTLVIRVLDAGGHVVGQQPVHVQSEIGHPGPFTADVPFIIPFGMQNGRIEVVDYSPKDGSVVASAAVNVRLRR